MAGGSAEKKEDRKVQVQTKPKVIAKALAKESSEIEEAFFSMVEKIQGMTLEQVWADGGLDLEKDQSRKQLGVYTLRITRGWRALCFLRSGPVIEIFGIRNPTEAHSVRRR